MTDPQPAAPVTEAGQQPNGPTYDAEMERLAVQNAALYSLLKSLLEVADAHAFLPDSRDMWDTEQVVIEARAALEGGGEHKPDPAARADCYGDDFERLLAEALSYVTNDHEVLGQTYEAIAKAIAAAMRGARHD